MNPYLKMLVLCVIILLLATALAYVIRSRNVEVERYQRFHNKCIVDNKALPRPDLYCESIWRIQNQGY